MTDHEDRKTQSGTAVLVRYWASVRAAAGRPEDLLEVPGPLMLDQVLARVIDLHPGAERLVGVCSVLLGDRPVRSLDPGSVQVRPGDVVELLPPFAGG